MASWAAARQHYPELSESSTAAGLAPLLQAASPEVLDRFHDAFSRRIYDAAAP